MTDGFVTDLALTCLLVILILYYIGKWGNGDGSSL